MHRVQNDGGGAARCCVEDLSVLPGKKKGLVGGRSSWNTQKFGLRKHLVHPAWETIINPGEGRDLRLSHHGNVLASVFLRLLVLESMWQIAVLAPYSGSKQGA